MKAPLFIHSLINSEVWLLHKVKLLSHFRLFATPWTVACQAPLSMEFSRQEYWSGSHSLLQGIFPTQGSNQGFPRCRQILYHLSHRGSQRILEWVACPFARGSSWPRKWTRVSRISGEFFTSWTTRKVHNCYCTEVKFAIPKCVPLAWELIQADYF